jgi:hypothetical protein
MMEARVVSTLVHRKEHRMKKALILAVPLLAAGMAYAGEKCTEAPPEKWLAPEEVQTRLQSKGYDVRRVKRDGSCFEVKATKDGKQIEAYVDPSDASVVKEKAKHRS